ncbi:Fcf2 pre-rRNA processing-domain-containing protein [Apodospora peruviana]|uniref:Fcf2 pre-rRNA processing-domain-containing protein n=1 Tax=Apodospora peruviana TaxID=516989 RepID=A0AAE0HV21_9PEZI|nr:Fcf2 pre-rRNA processing-domain-containing protein [Apodospora peruviana]
MATTTLGLPDAEIDRLLAEAEARLASRDASSKAVRIATPAAIAAPVVTPPTTGGQAVNLKKERKDVSVRVPAPVQKKKAPEDAGSDWFHMPKTNLTPELRRDLQMIKLRDVAAMGKQFFKRDTRKNFVPTYSQVGTILPGATDGMNNRLTRKEKKRTIVEEVLASEATSKYKSKYHEIQEKKQSGRKSHYKKLVAGRRKRS